VCTHRSRDSRPLRLRSALLDCNQADPARRANAPAGGAAARCRPARPARAHTGPNQHTACRGQSDPSVTWYHRALGPTRISGSGPLARFHSVAGRALGPTRISGSLSGSGPCCPGPRLLLRACLAPDSGVRSARVRARQPPARAVARGVGLVGWRDPASGPGPGRRARPASWASPPSEPAASRSRPSPVWQSAPAGRRRPGGARRRPGPGPPSVGHAP
jgi:hypothetical protein